MEGWQFCMFGWCVVASWLVKVGGLPWVVEDGLGWLIAAWAATCVFVPDAMFSVKALTKAATCLLSFMNSARYSHSWASIPAVIKVPHLECMAQHL